MEQQVLHCLPYRKEVFRLHWWYLLNGQMTIVAALEMEVVPRVCVDCIQKILPEIELLAYEEITNDAFCKELVRAERNNWTECYSGSLKEKLKFAIEPEHHHFF